MSTDHAPVPRPRPGFQSRDEPEVSWSERAALVATATRALVGVLCLFVAALYLPPSMVTPVLMGVSVLMIVSGAYSAWQLVRRVPTFRFYGQLVWWGTPIAAVIIFVLLFVMGGGAFGPNWSKMTVEQEPVTYQPAD